ncbi:uncharacterized protein Pyn_20442 [Prunus yedoensis var. nudiflora]|uniref:Uncharacterized protein n=1 Tax=Prunus yedoensis var. nudiflora TaxID=2094558 RepID=A0A314YIE3_PRUYE|nr:uncharacterized protein Pyn_20442 [Prunus yedoensis var. nudiflora]
MTSRLLVFLPQLEADLNNFLDAAEPNLRFLAMLAGPFYPILNLGNERDYMGKKCRKFRPFRDSCKVLGNISDSEVSKHSQLSSALTVSSNFEPRRSRGTSPFVLSTSSSIVFRADAIFVLLRKAYKDSDLGIVCRMAARVLHKLIEPVAHEGSTPPGEVTYGDEAVKSEITNPAPLVDYSNLFGEEFQLPGDHWDSSYLNILDIGAVEEGILHVLYACASQPQLCSKLADRTSDFWSALPLVQALLPVLRPSVSRPSDIVDDSFSQWKQPIVQQALSQIVATSCSSLYRPLLHACAGYLSSYSPSHAKAACVLIDLCCGVLAPWLSQVIAKVDLAVELLEDLLGVIQGARHSLLRARAALKYVVLALSGHMDDMLGKYKEVKHRILFLVEMLEPFLDPAVGRLKGIIAFGDLSSAHPEKQEENCVIALNVIRTAVQKPAVLPSLESEWRRGSVAPSSQCMNNLLFTVTTVHSSQCTSECYLLFPAYHFCATLKLEPHMQLPPEIDLRTSPVPRALEPDIWFISFSASHHGVASKSNSQDEFDGKIDVSDTAVKIDISEDASLLFAPPELHNIVLTSVSSCPNENSSVSNHGDSGSEPKHLVGKHFPHRFQIDLKLDAGFSAEYFNLQADYFQLITYQDCELRASEFRRLALDLHSQNEITIESHDAAIDALLLAAECYVNPFFMMSFRGNPKLMKEINVSGIRNPQNHEIGMRMVSGKSKNDLETISLLERKRDKIVLQILLEAAELDREYREKVSDGGLSPTTP